VVIRIIRAVIVAATLGAALGELLLHHGVVASLGGLGELAVRICALLVLWGPALLVFARLLYSAGFVVEAWESERPKDAQSEL
jgi:hypothetical protein